MPAGTGRAGASCLYGPRQIAAVEECQPGVADHEQERQGQHGTQVVRVQPAALPLARAEGEEVLEDALVHHHAGHQRQQHAGRNPADQPVAGHAAVQGVME
ncbi:hypothetical protein G6F40_017172 [Rhizopus arrhizus]|nr:hypothetical protein G6F40_017172 [Rhizopus arrhizus]